MTTTTKTTETSTMMKSLYGLLVGLCALLPAWAGAQTEPPDQGVCAKVKLEIRQELTFERIGFEGRLRVSNDNGDLELTNVQVELVVYTEDGDTATTSAFFIQEPRISGMIGLPDGTGVIPGGATAAIDWLFIPATDAGGTDPRGERYYIGGAMTAMVDGEVVDYPLFPDDVTVLPQPKLDIDYFIPRDVLADDPFTLDQIEEAIPFDLGVRINNIGWGPANKMTLSSGQPKIVENEKGLLIAFRLLEAFTHGSEIGDPSLSMTFGDVPAQSARIGRWSMISTLMGEFIEFSARYSHAPELGGELTSLIVDLDTNYLTKTMLIREPGFDEVEDFLADTTKDDDDLMPETIFSSQGQEFPVNNVTSQALSTPSSQSPIVTLLFDSTPTGWVYTRIPDPSQGLLELVSVRRSDGKNILTPENAWITKKIIRKAGQPTRTEYTFHLVDINSTGVYQLEFQTPPPDGTPPSTRVIVQEPFYGSDPVWYGTDETEFFLIAEDDISGIANTLWSVDGSGYLPSYPLILREEGEHTIEYYSVDRAGNAEPARLFRIITDLGAPAIDAFSAAPSFTPSISATGDAAVLPIVAQATDDYIPVVDLTIEVASAVAPETVLYSETLREDGGRSALFLWDGQLASGTLASPGNYVLRLIAADPLGHTTQQERALAIVEPFDNDALAANDSDQTNPDVDGNIAVWQDNRSGDWDIYMADLETGTVQAVQPGPGNQTRPRVSGMRVVYQDDRSGSSDVFLVDLATNTRTTLGASNLAETRPDIDGDIAVWTAGGDILVRDLAAGQTRIIVSNPQPQENPRISGNLVVYEDFRSGLSDIYVYDLQADTERRLTDALEQQEEPVIFGDRIVWTDKRQQSRDLYQYLLGLDTESNLTPTSYDEAEATLAEALLAFTHYRAGLADPNIALLLGNDPTPRPLTSDPAQQRRAAASGDTILWEDNRSGRWQIRRAVLNRPIADAGADLVTSSDLETALDGTASLDLGAAELTYAWTQVAGESVTLIGASTASPTFTAPTVTRSTRLVFALVVNNGEWDSAPDTVVVEVRASNQPPIADAGPDQEVTGGSIVALDGRGSSDPDNDPLIYTWTAASTQTVVLENPDTAQPRFTAPLVTTPTLVLLELAVSDGQYASLPDDVAIMILPRNNTRPIAATGANLAVNEREQVQLEGGQSYDPEGETLIYNWRQISGPLVTLTNPKTARPSFTAPEVASTTDLVFGLTVEDGVYTSEEATQAVAVRNVRRLPIADAGSNQEVRDTETVSLDGSSSFHPDNLPFQYIWTQMGGPAVQLSSTAAEQPSFNPPTLTEPDPVVLTFSLAVVDDLQASVPDLVHVTVIPSNTRPLANAGPDVTIMDRTGKQVTVVLDGTASADGEGADLTYQWRFVGTSKVRITGAQTARPSFTVEMPSPDQPIELDFELTVSDGTYNSAPETVKVLLLGSASPDGLTIY